MAEKMPPPEPPHVRYLENLLATLSHAVDEAEAAGGSESLGSIVKSLLSVEAERIRTDVERFGEAARMVAVVPEEPSEDKAWARLDYAIAHVRSLCVAAEYAAESESGYALSDFAEYAIRAIHVPIAIVAGGRIVTVASHDGYSPAVRRAFRDWLVEVGAAARTSASQPDEENQRQRERIKRASKQLRAGAEKLEDDLRIQVLLNRPEGRAFRLGERRYLVDGEIVAGLTTPQDEVLYALIRKGGKLDGPQLVHESGVKSAHKVMKTLTKHAQLGPFVDTPGKKGGGAYEAKIALL